MIFIEYEGTIYQMPVPPSEMVKTLATDNNTHEIIGVGEVSTLKGQKLREYEITSFFPSQNIYSFITTSSSFIPPNKYIELFEKIQIDRKTCRLIIPHCKINTLVSIESFEHAYRYGTDDIDYTLKLREFKEVSIKFLGEETNTNIDTGETIINEEVLIEEKGEERPKEGFALDDGIIVNGPCFYNSFGASPSGNFNNFNGIISHKANGNPYPVHITDKQGNFYGWVKEEQIKHAKSVN